MDIATRRLVRNRAGDRCEYCHLPQQCAPFATFHVQHIIARKHGGNDDPENLGLACASCNSFKGSNIGGRDSVTRSVVALYNPRQDRWSDHFHWNGPVLVGQSPIGRVTVAVLCINTPDNVELRETLIAEGFTSRDE